MKTVGGESQGDNVTMLVSSFTEPINVETPEAGKHHGDEY